MTFAFKNKLIAESKRDALQETAQPGTEYLLAQYANGANEGVLYRGHINTWPWGVRMRSTAKVADGSVVTVTSGFLWFHEAGWEAGR